MEKYIMIVDDAEEIRKNLSDAMRMKGYESKIYATGEEALSVLEKSFENPPLVILIDYLMPQMDGVEFMKKLRENPKIPDIPTYLLTAFPIKMNCESLGFQKILTKPVRLKKILEEISPFIPEFENGIPQIVE